VLYVQGVGNLIYRGQMRLHCRLKLLGKGIRVCILSRADFLVQQRQSALVSPDLSFDVRAIECAAGERFQLTFPASWLTLGLLGNATFFSAAKALSWALALEWSLTIIAPKSLTLGSDALL
jgi:hypothetical protein